MGLLSRIVSPFVSKATEGEYRDGPWLVNDGWLPVSWGSKLNWWQNGHSPLKGNSSSAIVQACVSAYAQTAAMCPGSHWKTQPNGGRVRVTSSALSRVLHRPNAYQTPSDFMLNLVSLLYRRGNAYAVALRNDRNEITELHIMQGDCKARVAEGGEIFYSLAGNEVIERQLGDGPNSPLRYVPGRDVLHVRLETPRHPLQGETPLTAAMLDLAASSAMARQALSFFDKQARPSGVLTTDASLTREQVQILRERWEEQAQGMNAGGTPILTNGLKWEPMTANAKDTQFAEIMKMTDQNVALAFRVPLQILGLGSTPYASTESLMQTWIASGLGFCLNHIELAFDQLFGLTRRPEANSAFTIEYTELDTSVLLRSNFKERMEGLSKAVIGGIYAPDEARAEEGLAAAPHGAGVEPRVQQQVVPLSYNLVPPEPEPDESEDESEDEPEDEPSEGGENDEEERQYYSRNIDDLVATYSK
jgi:HK97 family phage portal protein